MYAHQVLHKVLLALCRTAGTAAAVASCCPICAHVRVVLLLLLCVCALLQIAVCRWTAASADFAPFFQCVRVFSRLCSSLDVYPVFCYSFFVYLFASLFFLRTW